MKETVTHRGHFRSKALSVLLLVIGLLGLSAAGWAYSSVGSVDILGSSRVEGEGTLLGNVISGSGAGIENATVSISGTELTTTSGKNGTYVLRNVPSGPRTVVFESQGKRATVKTFIVPSETNNIDGTIYDDPLKNNVDNTAQMERMSRSTVYTLASVILFASFYAIFGSFLAYKGKRYKFTLSAAFVSLLSFGFCLGSLLAVVAIVLAIYAANEFERPKKSGKIKY